MGKSSRKNKEKKKDFQKVKLKVGKKKPMPDNFTNTAFKSQSVLMKEQFKVVDGAIPQTKKKQTIEDLLCTINHYNAKVRTSTLMGLKELLVANNHLIQDNLAALIQNVAHTFTDKDRDVRQAGHPVMQQVVKNIPSNLMVPFFPTMCAHLCCAMTHLQEDIQLDALTILDLLLVHYPSLVITRSKELLTNFIHQISQQGGHYDGAETVQLNISPGNKSSGQKWRVQVLQRLRSFLSAIVDNKLTSAPHHIKQSQVEEKSIIVSSQQVFVGIYKDRDILKHGNNETSTIRSLSQQTDITSQDFTSNMKEVVEFVHKVIPLILQCWMEARPNLHGNQQDGLCLTPWSIQTLHGVLSVMHLLWKWLELLSQEHQQVEILRDIQKVYEKKLLKAFFSNFPYSVQEGGTGRYQQNTPKMLVSVQEVNVLVCGVVSYLISPGQKQGWTFKLMKYVRNALEGDGQLSTEHAQMLLIIVERLMRNVINKDSKLTLLEALIIFYQNSHIMSQNKRLAMACIADMTLVAHKKPSDLTTTPLMAQFVTSLPTLLIELHSRKLDTSHHALNILLRSAAIVHPSAASCIQDSFQTLLVHIRSTECLNLWISRRTSKTTCGASPLMKKIDLVSFKMLCSAFLSPTVSVLVVTYAVQILTCKLLYSDELPFDLTHFVSFLITLSLGHQMEELLSLQQNEIVDQSQVSSQCSHLQLMKDTAESLVKSKKVCQVVCQSLRLISEDTTWKVFQQVTAKLLAQFTTIPFSSAYGIIFMTCEYLPSYYVRDDFVSQFIQLMVSVLCRTVRDYSADFMEDSWEEVLWKLAMDVLIRWNHLLPDIFSHFRTVVENYENKEQLRLIAVIVIRLLQTEDLKQVLIKNVTKLADFMQAIQIATKHFDETRWLAELRYQSDLFLGSTSHR
ncbi:putative testis-expressed sequence 10 protein-like [Apostichopus japonicus]|uniref:Putative testis-expressed sequence 10 protein-like n=1 Tax=Stichopus japonicus TaxID=307972 RepID=A0A2G8LQP3_STIJA|nr:putative testis-expressed sequence 10 protein-like [Apostichopus japonicus]